MTTQDARTECSQHRFSRAVSGGMFCACIQSVGSHHVAEELVKDYFFRFCSASPLLTDLPLILSLADECTLALLRGKDMECSLDQIECMFARLRTCIDCLQRWITMKRPKRSACSHSWRNVLCLQSQRRFTPCCGGVSAY